MAVVLGTIRAGDVEDNLYWGVVAVSFAVDGGESAEMQAADVSHDPGMARGDAFLGEELLESGEKVVDVIGRFEFPDVRGEDGRQAGGFGIFLMSASVLGAEGRIGAGDGQAALGAGAKAMLTAGEIVGGTGLSGVFCHDLSFFDGGWGVPYPGYFAKCAEAVGFKRVGRNTCLKV
jgi:hypothetical protein